MKRKNVCAKLLLLFLCFTLAFAGLVGCKTDELEEKMNAMQNELNGVKEDKAEAEALAELKALVEEVKATADAAATVAKFEEAIAKLESADAANSDALNTAKEELKALIDANADTADAATKAALKEALDKITALEAAAATKEALKTEVDALVAAIDKKADKTALEAAIADLQGKIDANGTADAETKAALQKAITDAIAASEKGDADKLAAAVATLNKTISANADKAAADLKNAADKAKQDLDAAVAKLESADTTNKAALDAAIEELEAAIAANGSDDADTKAALEAAIDANAKNDAALLAAAVATLENNIAAKDRENDKALSEAVEDLEGKIAAVDFTDDEELKAAIDAAVAEVNAKIDTKADKTALQNAVDALEDKIAAVDFTDDEELKAAIDAAVAQVNADVAKKANLEYVDAEIGKLNAAIKANADAIATLKADVDAAEARLDAAEAAIDALEADVEALKADVADLKTAATNNAEDIKAANDAIAALEARVKALEDDTTAADAIAEIKTAIEDLKKADTDNKAAVDKAIADLDAAYKDADAGLGADVDALKAAVEDLKKADADNKAAADKAIADLDVAYKAADEALKTELEGKIADARTALETQITDAKAELQGKINAVDDKLAALATKAEFTTLQGIVDTLKADVVALQEQIADLVAGKDSFKNDYEAATSVLAGESWLTVQRDLETDAVLKVIVEAAETQFADEYSIYAFEFIKNGVDKNHFTEADYTAFETEYDTLYFFLGRAVSPEAIVGYFDALRAYIKAMPSLIETLTKKLGDKPTVTTDPADLDDIDEIVELIEKNNWNEPIPGTDPVEYYEGRYLEIEYKDLYDAYVLVSAAHDNLVAAEENSAAVEETIAKIGYVEFTAESKALIDAARAAVDKLKLDHFSNSDWNAFYTEDETDIVENYQVLVTAEARYDQLTKASEAKITIIDAALEYENDRPLWTEYEALNDNLVAFNEWCAYYEIDELKDAKSITAIYGEDANWINKANLLKAAVLYAEAMKNIYEKTVFDALNGETITGVEKLNEAVIALTNVDSADVLWEDKALFEAYKLAYAKLEAEIADVKGSKFPGENKNFELMQTADIAGYIDAYQIRMDELDAAKAELDTLYAQYAGLVGSVTFKNYEGDDENLSIVKLAADIAKVYETASLTGPTYKIEEEMKVLEEGTDAIPVLVVKVDVEGDANVKAFEATNNANALYVTLINEYNTLTARVRLIYESINDYKSGAPVRLGFGNDIEYFNAYLNELVLGLGLEDADLLLQIPNADGGTDEANLADLMLELADYIEAFKVLAKEAELEAVTVVDKIKAILAADNLNNYDEIVSVYNVLATWINDYLASDVKYAGLVFDENEGITDISLPEVLAAIQAVDTEIKRLNPAIGEDAYYTFVLEEYYTTCVNTMKAADAHKNAAADAWNTLKIELDALIAMNADPHTWTIHDIGRYETADGLYKTYVNTYYAGAISNAKYAEPDTYLEFLDAYYACEDAVEQSGDDKDAIIKLIGELLKTDVTVDNAEDKIVDIADIYALIDAYKVEYCTDLCADCAKDMNLLGVAKQDCVAQLIVYAEAQKNAVNNDEATVKTINGVVTQYTNIILGVEQDTDARSQMAFAKSIIDAAVKKYNEARQ